MDLSKVLSQLREELANLDAAIASLERLKNDGPRRGRPPKALAQANKAAAASQAGPDGQDDPPDED